MKKIAIIGAGKTGRGFIGRLLKEADCEILFVDENKELVDKLNQSGSFKVEFFGNTREPMVVDNYTATTWENSCFDDVELIFVSVCGQNLSRVGEQLSQRLRSDKKYYIITCENASKPAETLKNAITGKSVAVSEATVFCTTIESDGYNINSENYPYLQCNAELLEGYIPQIASVKAINNFSDFLTRKLYTYNAASCVIAYIGAFLGFKDYGEAANNETVLKLLDKNYEVANLAMCKKYNYEFEDQKEFAALSKIKFCDRTIIDTVARNAREPHRKLGAAERIIGPIKLLRKYGLDASVLELTAAAAVLYEDSSDAVWQSIRQEKSFEEILTDICGLEKNQAIFNDIMEKIYKLQVEGAEIINSIANS